MERERAYKTHIVVFPYHGQGHINTMVQFGKRLASKGVQVTVATSLSNTKTMGSKASSIIYESVFDDTNDGGYKGPGGFKGHLERFKAGASKGLSELIRKFEHSENPVKCLVYDADLAWALDIAKDKGICGVAYVVHASAAIASYYPLYHEVYEKPMPVPAFSMPGLPPIVFPHMGSFGEGNGRSNPFVQQLVYMFTNIDKADRVLFQSFDKLEEEVLKWMSNLWPVRMIGPTLPSVYLDKRVENDNSYGFNTFNPSVDLCMKWLNTKETRSVVYISFGSAASLGVEQMAELAEALKNSTNYFLWVAKPVEQSKLPSNFVEETSEKGLVVTWCPQLEVLNHIAMGCFITHCGYNSIMEAICFGVPLVLMPQMTDQFTNAYHVEKVWETGVQPKGDEKGFISREEIGRCIEEVMHGERAEFLKKNAIRWKELAKEAVSEGGSSDKSIDEIISHILET